MTGLWFVYCINFITCSTVLRGSEWRSSEWVGWPPWQQPAVQWSLPILHGPLSTFRLLQCMSVIRNCLDQMNGWHNSPPNSDTGKKSPTVKLFAGSLDLTANKFYFYWHLHWTVIISLNCWPQWLVLRSGWRATNYKQPVKMLPCKSISNCTVSISDENSSQIPAK